MLLVLMAVRLCSAGAMSTVHFWHQASGNRCEVYSVDAMVELAGVAKTFHLDPASLRLKSGTSGRFEGLSTSGAVSLEVLRQHFTVKGSDAQPFVVDGEPEAGEGSGIQVS